MDFFIGGTSAMCAGLFSNPFDVSSFNFTFDL